MPLLISKQKKTLFTDQIFSEGFVLILQKMFNPAYRLLSSSANFLILGSNQTSRVLRKFQQGGPSKDTSKGLEGLFNFQVQEAEEL